MGAFEPSRRQHAIQRNGCDAKPHLRRSITSFQASNYLFCCMPLRHTHLKLASKSLVVVAYWDMAVPQVPVTSPSGAEGCKFHLNTWVPLFGDWP